MTLPVSVRPDAIPTDIKTDISNMTVGVTLTVGDLVLPPGVETLLDPSDPVVSASLTRAALVPSTEEGEEGGEGGEAAGGEAVAEESGSDEGGDESSDADGSDDDN
jgi:hypothetical protein